MSIESCTGARAAKRLRARSRPSPPGFGSSWAQLMRAQSIPAATRLSTSSLWVAASGGSVAMTLTRGAPFGRLPKIRSARPRVGSAGARHGRVGDVRFAGQAAQRHDQRVQRLEHPGLAAPERPEAARREPELQVGQVVAAQSDVMREVDRPRAGLLRRDAPFGPEPAPFSRRLPAAPALPLEGSASSSRSFPAFGRGCGMAALSRGRTPRENRFSTRLIGL